MRKYLIWFPVDSKSPYNMRVNAVSAKQALFKLISSPEMSVNKKYLYFDYKDKRYGYTPKYSKLYDYNSSLEKLYRLVYDSKDFDYIILKSESNSMSAAQKILSNAEYD